jgi:hypothetical protein
MQDSRDTVMASKSFDNVAKLNNLGTTTVNPHYIHEALKKSQLKLVNATHSQCGTLCPV